MEATAEEQLLDVLRLALARVLPIGDDPYGKVIDDGRHPWLSTIGRVDERSTNATHRD